MPPGVRLAWLMAGPTDEPPRAELVFRMDRLRRFIRKRVPWRGGRKGQALICPTENGATGHRTSCERCGGCWRPQPAFGRRLPLPLVQPER